jgi:hypothetical protein
VTVSAFPAPHRCLYDSGGTALSLVRELRTSNGRSKSPVTRLRRGIRILPGMVLSLLMSIQGKLVTDSPAAGAMGENPREVVGLADRQVTVDAVRTRGSEMTTMSDRDVQQMRRGNDETSR